MRLWLSTPAISGFEPRIWVITTWDSDWGLINIVILESWNWSQTLDEKRVNSKSPTPGIIATLMPSDIFSLLPQPTYPKKPDLPFLTIMIFVFCHIFRHTAQAHTLSNNSSRRMSSARAPGIHCPFDMFTVPNPNFVIFQSYPKSSSVHICNCVGWANDLMSSRYYSTHQRP